MRLVVVVLVAHHEVPGVVRVGRDPEDSLVRIGTGRCGTRTRLPGVERPRPRRGPGEDGALVGGEAGRLEALVGHGIPRHGPRAEVEPHHSTRLREHRIAPAADGPHPEGLDTPVGSGERVQGARVSTMTWSPRAVTEHGVEATFGGTQVHRNHRLGRVAQGGEALRLGAQVEPLGQAHLQQREALLGAFRGA